jgi:TetR/AcrR family transcriptional regulator
MDKVLGIGLIGNPSRACISYIDNLTSSAVTPDVVEAIQERNADTSGKGGELDVRSRKGAGLIMAKKKVSTPVKKKASRRPDEVRARIFEEAINAFAKYGYEGARLRSIAIDAGISIQLLVHHVKSKEKLWKLTMEHIIDRYQNSVAVTHALNDDSGTLSAGKRLKQAIADIAHFTASMPQLHRIVTAEAAHATPRMLWLAERFVKQGYEDWCSLIEAAQREGVVRKASPARLRYAIVAMISVPFAVAAEYEYFTGKSPFAKNEISEMIEMVCAMVFIREP